jgi:hypothetical protein
LEKRTTSASEQRHTVRTRGVFMIGSFRIEARPGPDAIGSALRERIFIHIVDKFNRSCQ